MSPQAQLVMLLWMPVLLLIFRRFPARKAVIISFLVAWLFLPHRAGFSLLGLPDYARMSATSYGILLATALFDSQCFGNFRLAWLDLPLIIWCICPLFSSISNGLGAYDGFSSALAQTVAYGIPYFLGRIYFQDLAGLRQLAIAIFISGLIYAPLCLWESRMSPRLHFLVYGYFSHNLVIRTRAGGWRPSVFMLHGLEVGMWMMAVALIGVWLWQAKTLKTIGNIPINWLAMGLVMTFILVKSTGAYLYFAIGIVILLVAKRFRNGIPLVCLILAITFYLSVATTGNVNTQQIDSAISIASDIAGEERAQSFGFRLSNEYILVKKALEKPILGWGGWGRNRVYEENWEEEMVDVTVTDSLWIIAYGINGIVGVISFYASFFLPVLSFMWTRYPPRHWFHPQVAPAAVLSVVITLYMLDCVLNYMPNPVFTLILGGITGLVIQPQKTQKTRRKISRSLNLSA